MVETNAMMVECVIIGSLTLTRTITNPNYFIHILYLILTYHNHNYFVLLTLTLTYPSQLFPSSDDYALDPNEIQ